MDNQTRQLLLTNDVDELNRLAAFVENICEEWNLPVVWQTSLNMALEEAVSNIIFYAWDDGQAHSIEMLFVLVEGKWLQIDIFDDGRPYDPTKKEDPDISLSVEDRPIGGLGIFLIKKVMDQVEYAYENGRNHLRLTKKLIG